MFKRESEQPVRISFEEKREKRKKRSLKERLSSIPVRRRVEAVILAVVTVMASLSIDWSSLSVNAAGGEAGMESGQSISTVFMPPSGQDTTTLSKAKISVKIPSADKEVNYTWKVYQNLKDDTEPESGVPVGDGGSGKIEYSSSAVGGFVEKEVTLSDVVLLGDETAAVVFTLTSEDGNNITYKIFDTSGLRYVKSDGNWIEYDSGNCIAYTSSSTGTPTDVTLSDKVPTKLALTAGQSYTFPEDEISWSPKYQRTLTLTEKEDTSNLIEEVKYPTFKVADSISNGGTAKVTVGGTGVTGVDVDVNVVSFELKGDGADKSVFTYTGAKYNAGDLYTAKCDSTTIDVASNFITTYKGTLINGTSVTEPLNAGSYTMTIKGKDGTAYAGLTYTKAFKIEQGTLTQDMFTGDKLASKSVATVKSGKIESITDGTFSSTRKLVYGVDFDAEVTKTTPGATGVEYEITITGKNNFKNGDTAPTLNATEDSGVSLKSVVDHIGFATQTETYDADAKTPEIVFYDSSGEKITGVFTRGTNYTVKYNGTKRSTGTVVTDADEIIDAGEYTATIYGKETYAGSSMSTLSTEPYVLKPISFTTTNVTVTLKESSFEYSDSLVISPEVKDVTYKPTNRGLAAGTEYVMKSEEYSRQIGSHLVTIEGYGNYEGEATAEYTVFPSLLTSATFALDTVTDGTLKAEKTAEWDYVWTHNRAYTYRGSAIVPEFTANVNGETLSVGSGTNDMTKGTGINNSDVTSSGSKAYFILKLPTKYAGKKIKVEFEIGAKPLPPGALSFQNEITKDYAYGDHPITLDNGIDFYVKDGGTTLTEGTHYTISYENNENAGTATITATGIGNYTGTSSKTFTITPISVDSVAIKINPQKLNTSGTVVTDMNDVVITVIDGDGNELHPFTSDDFTLSGYKNNLNAWTAGDTESKQPQVTLTGKRNLTGTQVVKFEILKETLSGLKWKLNGTSINGILGSPGTTVDTGYVVSYAPNLPSKTISLYYSSGAKFESKNYTCKVNAVQAGTNTITIVGKGDYDGGEYKFTYKVRKLDISSADCVFTQTDGDENTLPTFKLTYGGVELTTGEDNDYTYVTDAEKDSNGKYVAKDGYTVTFTGKNSYTGTRTETFHIGKPFDSDHVFVTMYGPAGTKTVNGENRLTYFGNNDPYFILTSKDGTVITGPAYEKGLYQNGKKAESEYEVFFSPDDATSRHKVGTTVTVTFKAKDEGDTWYKPENSNGIEYKYTVVPGSPIEGTGYGVIGSMLSVYTMRDDGTPGSESKIDERIKFPGMTGWDNEINLTRSSAPSVPLVYKYTTEPADPNLWISYNPVASARASQSQGTGIPELGNGISSYADPFECPFSDIFTFKQGSTISATDTDKRIIVTPTSASWLRTTNNNKEAEIRVAYDFDNASLSDAKIIPKEGEYTYSGATVNLDYTVTIGSSTTLIRDTDYKVVGYYKYPSEATTEKTNIDSAINNPSSITSEPNFGTKLDGAPKDVGEYVFVIGPASNSNYEGYNIARFSIKSAGIKAKLKDPGSFSVTYGDTNNNAPKPTDLDVVDAYGNPVNFVTNDSDTGYKIGTVDSSTIYPRTDAEVDIIGTGNYAGSSDKVQYKVKANIDNGLTTDMPDFSITNLYLTNSNLKAGDALQLTLKNNDGYPYIDVASTTRFDPETLTLSYMDTADNKITLDHSWLEVTVTDPNGGASNLTTVGKKTITITPAENAPVKGTREYNVEVFADISTADITLEAGSKPITGTEISYTGSAITIEPVVMFNGSLLGENDYAVIDGNSAEEVGGYTLKLEGKASAYYKNTATKDYTVVYDLKNDVQILYKNKAGKYEPLAGVSFDYTGESIVTEISKNEGIKVRFGKEGEDYLKEGQNYDYTLTFANDIKPGGNTASVTINHTSKRSINSQTVYFSIGGNKITKENCFITLTSPNEIVYDGTKKEPEVSVTYTDKIGTTRNLTKDADYKVTYSNNINATTEGNKAIITVTGINGKYSGSVTGEFDISKATIGDLDVKFPNVAFGGRDSSGNLLPGKATITVTVDGRTLVAETDYDIKYGDGTKTTAEEYFTKDPGASDHSYTITVTGKGNYTGSVSATADQLSGTLKSSDIVIEYPSDPSPHVYNGKKVTFGGTGPVIKNGESTLEEGSDYEIEIPEIINVGTYEIKITALPGGDYYGNGSSKTFTYTVTPRSVEENEGAFVLTLYDPTTGNSGTSFKWTGNKIQPLVKLVDTGITERDSSVGDIWTDVDSLKQNIMMDNFIVTYGDNRFAGKDTGSVTLTASGNYKDSITRTFSIGTDIANATLSYDKTSAEYDGTPKSQEITVRYNNNTLEAGVAYQSPITYTYTDSEGNVQETTSPSAVGTYVPVIMGKTDGGYYGELKGSPFRIIAQNKTGNIKIKFNGVGGEVDAADYVCHYNTKKQTPSISVYDTSGGTDVALTENVDYTVSYGNNTNAGSGYVYVALKGNYTGTAQEIFTIQPYDISNATLEFTEGENGIIKNAPEASFPYSPLFRLRGTDDNGEQFVISYADSRQKQDLSIPDSSKVKKPGKGSLAVSGTGNNLYGTTNVYDYEVYGRLSEKNVIATPPINTGVKKDPEVKVVFAGETLVLDTDYSLRIVPFDQTVSGGGNVIVEGLGYFTGSVYTKYGEASDVSSLTLRGFSQQYIYSGVFAGPQESAIYAVDKDGNTVISADKLECTFTSDKDNAACITANATVTITTKATLEDGTVQDGPKATYKIVPRNINSCDIMRLENDIYTGKALKPPVAVSFRRKEYTFGSTGGIAEEKVLDVITLKEGTDYSLSYKNNVYPGTADITVTGKGNYTGTRLFHFVINVISMGSVNAKRTSDGIVVSWGARPYVAGYRVLYDTEKLTAVSTTGTTVTLKDALPTRVGVQPYILGSGKTPIYGAAKYIDVS